MSPNKLVEDPEVGGPEEEEQVTLVKEEKVLYRQWIKLKGWMKLPWILGMVLRMRMRMEDLLLSRSNSVTRSLI